MKSVLERAVNTRYAVVVFERTFVEPMVNAKAQTFTPGSITRRIFIVDLTTKKIVGGFDVSATNNDLKVKVTFDPRDQSSAAAGVTALIQTLMEDVDAQTWKRLAVYGSP